MRLHRYSFLADKSTTDVARKGFLCRLKNTRVAGEVTAMRILNLTRLVAFFLVTGPGSSFRQSLRRSVQHCRFMAALLLFCFVLPGCEKDFDLKPQSNKPLLVVEAYINNQMRDYNYVVLSHSLDYLSLDFQGTPVKNATVTITEGERINNKYTWDQASRVQLFEANLAQVPQNFRSGVYFDKRLLTDSLHALLGRPGKSYLLEIKDGVKEYSAIATLLPPVQIDSLTTGYGFIDEDDGNKKKLRITNHYQDPDTINNTQLYYYRFSENRNRFGWGGLYRNRIPGTDELTNGQHIDLTHTRGFVIGDTVNYYMASVTRDVYNFWESFNDARNNNGPFATPVTLESNIIGNNVTGCFSGMSLSSKTIIIR
jgi:hypothetical protein